MNTPDITNLQNAALVVAHPDDEILWFSSIIDDVADVHICYMDVPGEPGWTEGRYAARAAFPMSNAHFVGLTEAVSFQCASWSEPIPSAYGLELNNSQAAMPEFDPARYESNFKALVEYLQSNLHRGQTVITHNPWGEYGHEDHVQVHRAVLSLKEPLDLDVWHSNYVSDRSANLMARTLATQSFQYLSLPTNLSRAAQIEKLYRETNCWTWPFDEYQWFDSECLIRASEDTPSYGGTLPLNFVNVDMAEQALRHNQPKQRLSKLLLDRLLHRS